MSKVTITAPSRANLTDLSLLEVHCFECGKPIPTIPSWLSDAKVKFQCEECRLKHPRIPGMPDIDARRATVDLEHLAEIPPIVEDEEVDEEELDEEAQDEPVEPEE